MIRRTLAATQSATFSVDLPNPRMQGLPSPTGTGFFVSPDGWFVTAAHVVTKDNRPDGHARDDIDQAWLMKEARPGHFIGGMCQNVRLEVIESAVDFALLKVDFDKNAGKDWLRGSTCFPYLHVSTRQLEEGEPVYAFGYPLSRAEQISSNQHFSIAHVAHSPRTTSAIVAATMEHTGMVSSSSDPEVYVLDKALNYGNSGGPIVAVDSGHVHALCSRFQQVQIPQRHLRDQNGQPLSIEIPSLYGVVSSLHNVRILDHLRRRGVPLTED